MQKRTVHFETLGTILQEPYMAVTEWGALLALLWYRGGRDLDGVDKTKEVTRWDQWMPTPTIPTQAPA